MTSFALAIGSSLEPTGRIRPEARSGPATTYGGSLPEPPPSVGLVAGKIWRMKAWIDPLTAASFDAIATGRVPSAPPIISPARQNTAARPIRPSDEVADGNVAIVRASISHSCSSPVPGVGL